MQGGGEDGVGRIGGCGDGGDGKGDGGGKGGNAGGGIGMHVYASKERWPAGQEVTTRLSLAVSGSAWSSSTVRYITYVPTSTAAASTVSVATATSPSTSMALASSAASALQLYAAMMPVAACVLQASCIQRERPIYI